MSNAADVHIRFEASPKTFLTDIAVRNEGGGDFKVSVIVRPDKDDDSKTLVSTFLAGTGMGDNQAASMINDARQNDMMAVTAILAMSSFSLLNGIRPRVKETNGIIEALDLEPVMLMATYGLLIPCAMHVSKAMQESLDLSTTPEQKEKMILSQSGFNRNIADARSQLFEHAALGEDAGSLVLTSGVAAVVFNTIYLGSSFMFDVVASALNGLNDPSKGDDRSVHGTVHRVH